MLVLLSVLGCVKVPAPSPPSAAPGSNASLRSSFDADASPDVGRFVPPCPAWVNAPPTTTDGLVLVGRSKAVKDDADARKAALEDAQRQLWQSIGAGPGDADGDMGAALQAKEWCVETHMVDGQPRFVGNVLVTVPQVTIDAMRRGAAKREAATDAWMNGAGEAPRNAPRSVDATPAQADAGRAAAASAPAPGVPAPGAGAVLAGAALSDTELAAVGARIDAAAFSADKLQALLAGTQGRSLTAAQAANLLRRFAFSSDQLVALGHLAPGIRNRQDAALIVEVFTFSADKARAQELLR